MSTSQEQKLYEHRVDELYNYITNGVDGMLQENGYSSKWDKHLRTLELDLKEQGQFIYQASPCPKVNLLSPRSGGHTYLFDEREGV